MSARGRRPKARSSSTPPPTLLGYSVRPAMHRLSASRAASASSPSAVRRRVVPRLAPSARIASRLFASASRSPAATVSCELKPSAVRTKLAAGRACRSTSAGSATSVSELVCIAGILRRLDDGFDVGTYGGDYRRGDRAFHERRVGQADDAVAIALEYVANSQDRAAEVPDHDDSVTGVRAPDRVADATVIRSER